jgi:branched-chain amino acid aminotransferase
MSIRVYVDGRVLLPEAAFIPVFNRGFLFGESVFESVGTVHGEPFAMTEHLERLENSAAQLGISVPSRMTIEQAVRETVAAAGNPESRIRIVVTQGGGIPADGRFELVPAEPGTPELVVIVMPLHGPSPEMVKNGVFAEIVSIMRNHPGSVDPSIKSGNYLSSVLALREARARNPKAHEAILCSPDGFIAEGATSNVFLVTRGVVRTPALDVGILAGITRSKVLQVVRAAGIPVQESRITPDELRHADETFLTSAARGVLPVVRIDGQNIGDGIPGPLTQKIMALYGTMGTPSVSGKGVA